MITVYNPWVLTNGSLFTLGMDPKDWNVLLIAVIVLFTISILTFRGKDLPEIFTKQNVPFKIIFLIIGIMAVIIFGAYGADYSASQFIYFQF